MMSSVLTFIQPGPSWAVNLTMDLQYYAGPSGPVLLHLLAGPEGRQEVLFYLICGQQPLSAPRGPPSADCNCFTNSFVFQQIHAGRLGQYMHAQFA